MESSQYSALGYFLKALKQYVDFSGRARRKEYWFYFLFYVIFSIILTVADTVLLQVKIQDGMGVLSLLFSLALFLPTLAVSVRRLHDTGRSGWWLLISLIPLLGIVLLVFVCQDSREDNKYGANPKVAKD